MKALVVTGDHRLELREVSKPVPGPYEALVKVLACGICSTTDREIIKGTQPYASDYPCILGHESIGEVVEVGSKVTAFKVGDWVRRAYAIFGGESRDGLYGGWGGFAEYGIVRDGRARAHDSDDESLARDYTALRQQKVKHHDSVPLAVLAISLAEVSSWFNQIGSVRRKTVVVGGTGIAGYCAVICAKLRGARRIIVLGRRQERLDRGIDLGADAGVNVRDENPVARIREAAGGSIDVFCECVGNQTIFEIALDCLSDDGIIAVYGVPPGLQYALPLDKCVSPRRVAAFAAQEYLTYDWALDLLRSGKVDARKLLTHVWRLEDYEAAFAALERGEVVKGMLTMGCTPDDVIGPNR
ncbi:MAG: zinc-binding dehydrogenase [Planctomycetota bacterium]